MKEYNPHSNKVGCFSDNDGTIDFYSRINCLINNDFEVLDFGAGRGEWVENNNSFMKKIRNLKGKVKKVYACDVDEAVNKNNTVDEVLQMKGDKVLCPDESFDIIFADFVLEHIKDPLVFSQEINRLLKPGGWFCARSPHKYNLISIFNKIIPKQIHISILKYVQPSRKEVDVFPAYYRLNSLKELKKYFRKYKDKSFIFRSDPSYFFGNKHIYHFQKFLNNFLFEPLVGTLFVYKQKN